MVSPRRSNEGRAGKGRDSSSVREVRKAARRVSRRDLFDDSGFLKPRFQTDPRVYAWFQKRHKSSITTGIGEDGVYRRAGHEWKVPYGVRLCLRRPLLWTQMVKNTGWTVVWRSPKTGRRLKKYFGSPIAAIDFICTKAQYVDHRAALVSRMGYDIPAKLRGKIPKPYKWCPMCMNARRFKRVASGETFYAKRKEWITEKARYEYRDRQLALMECTVCGCTNRDTKMRRSNQPWEIRKFKRGARRAKRRR